MCYMIVKNTSSPPDAPRSPARAPGGHRLPPGVLSCRWPASSPHAFVTCLLSRQAAAYNSRCSTRWLSSPDRTLPRRPQLPARRRRPRFIFRRFFRLFRQLHRDFFFLPAGEALGVSGVRHSGGPALGCLLHAIVRTAKCVREMRFYTSTCSFKNTVKKHPFLSCLRIGPSYPTPPWLPARPAGRSCPRCSRGLRPPSLHAAQTLPLREPFREPCWARRRPPCDRPHSRGVARRSRPGRVRSAEPRHPRAGTVQVPHAGIRDTWAGPALRSRPPVGFASADSITTDGKQHFRIPTGSFQAAWKTPFGIRAESADWKGRL